MALAKDLTIGYNFTYQFSGSRQANGIQNCKLQSQNANCKLKWKIANFNSKFQIAFQNCKVKCNIANCNSELQVLMQNFAIWAIFYGKIFSRKNRPMIWAKFWP